MTYRTIADLPAEIRDTFCITAQKRFKSVYNRESAKDQHEVVAWMRAYNEAVRIETGKSVDLDQYSDSDGIIEGLGIPYGGRLQFEQADGSIAGRDFDGEYFDEKTDYTSDIYDGKSLVKSMPVLYDHGLDDTLKGDIIGEVKSIQDTEKGKWFTIQLNRAHEYYKYLLYLAKCGALSLSTGAKNASRALDGHIDRWELQEISLTPSACNPMAQIAMKSILCKSLGDIRMEKEDLTAEVVAAEDLEEPEKKVEDPVEDAEATEQAATQATEDAPVQEAEKACEDKADWDEDKHPRANNGQFSSSNGGGSSSASDDKPKEEPKEDGYKPEPGEGTNPHQAEAEDALHSALANNDREAVASVLGKLPQGTVMTNQTSENDQRFSRDENGWNLRDRTGTVGNLTDEMVARLLKPEDRFVIQNINPTPKEKNMDKTSKACDKAEEETQTDLLARLEDAYRAVGEYLTNMRPADEPEKAEDDDETITELADNAEHDVDEALEDEHHGHDDEAEHDEVDADEEIEKLRDEIDEIKEELKLEAEKKKAVELENITLKKTLEDCVKRVEAIELRLTSQPVLHPVANPKFGDVPQTRANLEELANNKNFSPSTRYEISRAVAADEIADIMGVER